MNVDSGKMSVGRTLFSARFEECVRALQALVNAYVEWKVMLMAVMTKFRELLDSRRSINMSYFSVKTSKVTRKVLQLICFLE